MTSTDSQPTPTPAPTLRVNKHGSVIPRSHTSGNRGNKKEKPSELHLLLHESYEGEWWIQVRARHPLTRKLWSWEQRKSFHDRARVLGKYHGYKVLMSYTKDKSSQGWVYFRAMPRNVERPPLHPGLLDAAEQEEFFTYPLHPNDYEMCCLRVACICAEPFTVMFSGFSTNQYPHTDEYQDFGDHNFDHYANANATQTN